MRCGMAEQLHDQLTALINRLWPNGAWINYICVKEKTNEVLDPDKYIKKCTFIRHRSYQDLKDQIVANCPKDHQCVDPIALYHGLVIQPRHPATDELHHAVEEGEYPILFNNKQNSFIRDWKPSWEWHPTLSIHVYKLHNLFN